MAMKLIGRIGDRNAVDYGGGAVFQGDYGPFVEYTFGAETDAPEWDQYADDAEETAPELEVFSVQIPEDLLSDLDWVDWKGVADSIGMPVRELKGYAKDPNPMARASVIEAVAGYHGWRELDSYPNFYNYFDLETRWGG